MDAFATVQQLFTRLRLPEPSDTSLDYESAQEALADATAELVRITGQSLEAGESTVTERVPVGGVVNLPIVPAREIHAVVNADTGHPVTFEFENSKQVLVHAPARSRVRITYTRGYTKIPPELVKYTCVLAAAQLAAADAGNLGLSGGISGISIDDGRVSFATRPGEQGEGLALPARIESSLRSTYGSLASTVDHRQ